MKKSSETFAVKVFTAVKVLLGLLLVCVVVEAVVSQAQIPDSSGTVITQIARETHSKTTTTRNTLGRISMQIPATNPFQVQGGRYQEQAAQQTYESGDLKLVLVGTVAGNPSVARAIIKDLQSDTLKPYRTGQQVGNGTVDRIERDRVFVSCAGKTYVLRLEMGQPVPGEMQIADKYDSQPAGRSPQESPAQPDALFAYDELTAPKTQIEALKSVLSQAKLDPCELQGEVQGLLIASLDNVPGAKEAGLKDGDVIHRVNGHKLVNKQQAWQVLRKARSTGTIDIEVLREDK